MATRVSRWLGGLALVLVALVAWTVLVVGAALEGWGRAPLAPRGNTQAFLEAARARVDEASVGNAVFALLEDGEVVDTHAVSVGEPVGPDTVFPVSSLGKWVSAWGVMTLVEQGRIELDAPVATYLSRWSLPESGFDHDEVTVRRLLSHTAGLTDGLGYHGFEPGTPVQTLEDSLTRAADAAPGRDGVVRVGLPPGSQWRYSGGGYTLLQLIVEEASGESFETYMRRAVFDPLGMSHSSYAWTPTRGERATFYDLTLEPIPHRRYTALAATSLHTSVSDLVRFLQAHLAGKQGEPIGRGVLRPKTLWQMWQPHATQFGADIWGLGTMLFAPDGEGGVVVGHDGNKPTSNTAARLNPATGNGFVMLETGSRLLATELAGEWVFWETGNLDFLTVTLEFPGTLRTLALGALVIVLGAVLLAVLVPRLRRGQSGVHSGAAPQEGEGP